MHWTQTPEGRAKMGEIGRSRRRIPESPRFKCQNCPVKLKSSSGVVHHYKMNPTHVIKRTDGKEVQSMYRNNGYQRHGVRPESQMASHFENELFRLAMKRVREEVNAELDRIESQFSTTSPAPKGSRKVYVA